MATTSAATSTNPVVQPRVAWGTIAGFVAISFGLAWLIAIPLWTGGGLAHPQFQLIAGAMMFTPAIAAVVMVLIARRSRTFSLGLGLKPVGRTILLSVIAVFAFPALTLLAVVIAWMLGAIPLDWANLSGYRAGLESLLAVAGPDAQELLDVPIHLLALLQVLNIPLNTLLAAVIVFGEEFGWRGWLLPALRPLGVWPALIASGVIWGLWHSPIILLGYNFGRTDITGVLMMIVFCVLSGIVLGWLRLRSGNLWPAVFAHAAINASAAIWPMMLIPAGFDADPFGSNFVGWPGWIVLAIITVILVATGQFRPERLEPAVRTVAPAASVKMEESDAQRNG